MTLCSDRPDILDTLSDRDLMTADRDGMEDMSGEMSGMAGVRAPSASMTQSMMATPSPSLVNDKTTPDLMTTSMNSLSGTPSKSSKRPLSHRNETSQNWFLFENGDENEGRTDVSAAAKEREERVRRLREQQEDERKKKLEELKQHALSSQKFREQQEVERRRHIEDLRSKDQERRNQVEERRKEIEKAENERREALFQRNKEREDRINTQRKNSRSHIDFAFGSSAPRLLEPRIDSGYWGSRSSADRNSAERETDLRNKRTVSAQGLDRSTEGEEDGLVGGFSSGAHRRRTDLVPTIMMPRGGGGEGGRSGTPSKMTRSPGRAVSMSRIDQLSQPRRYTLHVGQAGQAGRTSPSKSVSMSHLGGGGRVNQTRQHPQLSLLDTNKIRQDNTKRPRSKTTGAKDVTRSRTATGTGISRENTASRPGSAMSGTSAPPRSGGAVRLRSAPSRRPRPTSIATTGMTAGMTASMYEERQKPIHVPRQKLLGTPKADRMKRARSVTSDTGVDDDAKSTTSSIGGSRTPARKTPAQVKAEAAARKAKATRQTPSTPKTSTGKREVDKKSPSPALSSENVARSDGDGENQRQITPDIIKDNNKEKESDEKESSPEGENDNSHDNRERNIISSEEEAKARIAQKRKEMKEKKEREEELERQRQAELERLEEERRLREEEEERKMMIEADRLAAEARIAEEERVQKAIEEAELERKRQEEEEEKLKKEKEEVEKKAKEEAEKREIELQEKLKKEEEERLARKKRIEEIMARTRGKNSTPNTTPKKEVEPEAEEHQTPSQPASLNIDPTKPDLLGDINDSVSVAAENAKNIEVSASSSISENGVAEESKDVVKNGDAEVEKGTIDSISKADLIVNSNNVDIENSKSPSPSPLIDVEEPPKKPGNAVSEGGAEFDQLIDLGQLQDTNKTDQPEHSPIIAFEDSITSPRQQQNAAELLS